MTVVDASVAIKWFVEEPGSPQAHEMLARGQPLTAPDHLIGEVARGLLRRTRAGDFSRENAKSALVGLPAMVSLAPMEALAPLAFDLADECSITIYDAFYVALAIRTDDVLITADERLRAGLASSRWAGRAQVLRGRRPET